MHTLDLCATQHRRLIFGTCPWCQQEIVRGEVALSADLQALKKSVYEYLLARLDMTAVARLPADDAREDLLAATGRFFEQLRGSREVSPADKQRIVTEIVASILDG